MAEERKCWICGAAAESREHLIKASDIRAVLGNDVSQAAPFYLHSAKGRNQEIGGINSKKLKYSASLCSHCNNNRTQPHDYAWQQLSEYLRARKPALKGGDVVKFNRVFEQRPRASMLHAHLFFVKQLGCLISEHGIPLDLQPFADSIVKGVAHPNVHMSFWIGLDTPGIKAVGQTNVHAKTLGEKVVVAKWFYFVDPISVMVECVDPGHGTPERQSWHPGCRGKRVVMLGLADAQAAFDEQAFTWTAG